MKAANQHQKGLKISNKSHGMAFNKKYQDQKVIENTKSQNNRPLQSQGVSKVIMSTESTHQRENSQCVSPQSSLTSS